MFRVIAISAWVVLSIAVGVLGYSQMRMSQEWDEFINAQTSIEAQESPSSSSPSPSVASANATSLSALQASVSALQSQVSQLQKSSGKTTTTVVNNTSTAAFQTQIVYLGSASTTSNSWSNTGVQITLNSADYPAGTPISFQAGLSIIGGQAWARLINSTTGAIMDITQVQNGTSTVTWANSPSFQLAPGSNTYTVQMRSTSGEVAQMAGARLVIGTQ